MTTRMGLESILLSEVKSEKNKYCIITLIVQNPKKLFLIETESRMMVVRV